ncbi:MAG: cytochrome c3 family protein [Ectothiorhodospiraceae bacterium]|nr:cytochrome c3 family protein [Chromatiales bacterium]MCP5154600.1 cytochrome c3 family protein [Ectothiorhodospiraceae bacterium]
MSLKRLTRHIVVGTALALATGGAWAGIANTKHNLGNTGTGTNHATGTGTDSTTTDEICVFCHTPHGANTGAGAPLWNKTLPSSTYTTYATTSTLDSSVLAVGSVSIACLSCHDGTQAMNSMINEPGSGLDSITDAPGSWTAWTGDQTVTGAANLGEDLSNDHPIGVAYAGGGCGSLTGTCTPASDTSVRDKDFKVALETSSGSGQWFVDTGETSGVAGARDKNDMILYTRDFSGQAEPSVECGSCHDPHSESSLFLRRTDGNTESQVCLSCHTK